MLYHIFPVDIVPSESGTTRIRTVFVFSPSLNTLFLRSHASLPREPPRPPWRRHSGSKSAHITDFSCGHWSITSIPLLSLEEEGITQVDWILHDSRINSRKDSCRKQINEESSCKGTAASRSSERNHSFAPQTEDVTKLQSNVCNLRKPASADLPVIASQNHLPQDADEGPQ